MLLSSRECPGGRQRYGSGMQGRVCRKRQLSQILAASLKQHTLHNYDDSIRTIMIIISLLLQNYGNPRECFRAWLPKLNHRSRKWVSVRGSSRLLATCYVCSTLSTLPSPAETTPRLPGRICGIILTHFWARFHASLAWLSGATSTNSMPHIA